MVFIDPWMFVPLLSLVVPALAIVAAVAVWKVFRVGKQSSRPGQVLAVSAFVLVLGTLYVVAFFALWAWGSGS